MTGAHPPTTAAVAPRPDPPAGTAPPSLATVVQLYQTPLLRYVAHLLHRTPDLAQDVVQDTFLRYHTALVRGPAPQQLPNWLFRVAHHLAIDTYRQQQRTTPLGDEQLDTLASPPDPALAGQSGTHHEAGALAIKELAQLPAVQRQVLTLKLLENFTLAEISQITDLPVHTVFYRLQQGLRTLHTRLRAHGVALS